MYSLISFVTFCLMVYYFNSFKNQKLGRTKSFLNLLCESILQVATSYVLLIISLRLVKGISIIHTLNSIIENRLKFVIKFSAINLIFLAIILFLSFVFKAEIKKHEKCKHKPYIFSFIFIFLLVHFLMLTLYIDALFPELSIDQVIFTLTMPLAGTSRIIITTSVIVLIVIPLIFSIFDLLLAKANINFCISIKKQESIIFPLMFRHKILSSLIFLIVCISFFNFKFSLLTFLGKELKGNITFYEENYISPKDVKFVFPEHKKNLIFIYLESIEAEASYCAKEGTNLIPELAKLAKNNLSFSHSDDIGGQMQVSGSTHSIASICCTHLGLPLLVNLGTNFYKSTGNFFNGAYGLGNILQGGGYNCLFLLGSEITYGGMDRLLGSHGFEIKDINYYKNTNKVPKDYNVWWGIEDAKLVEFAKEELHRLGSLNQPFAFSVFFEDTHFPGGYFCEECEKKYPKQIHNVYACLSKRIDKFVNWIKEQPFYKDTVIVILGDHLYMGNDLYDDNRPNAKRHAYNVFINTGKSNEYSKNREFCTFDYFPTIIDCLDIKYEENGLGLGRSLLSGKPTLLEQLGIEKLEDVLTSKSLFYRYSLLNKE